MNRSLTLGLAALLAASPAFAATEPALPHTLPATMDQLRFIVHAKARGGATLELVTDSAGGTNITTLGATKLGLPFTMPEDPRRQSAGKAMWPQYTGAWIPAPKAGADGKVELPILVPPRGIALDGLLGARWFADRTWEWDYRAGTLRLLPNGALPKLDASHVLAMGFRQGVTDPAASGYARIPARIDGEDLQFLFDTGATFRLGRTAATAMGDASVRERAGSFIAIGVMKQWRAKHPDWPFVLRGDSGAPMIRVPDIELAGWHTGPVWFSARLDNAFHDYIAALVDRPVDGALGGNAFATFRVTADYPSARVAFEQLVAPPKAMPVPMPAPAPAPAPAPKPAPAR
jgi:hypothetical protein